MSETPKTVIHNPLVDPNSIWNNDLPAGDAPPLPRWPLTAAIVSYTVWMVFLIAMAILRLKYAG